MTLSANKPYFRLYRAKLAWAIIESGIVFAIILGVLGAAASTFTLVDIENLVGVIIFAFIIFVIFYLTTKDYLFFEDHLRIERLFRSNIDLPYDRLILSYSKRVSRPFRVLKLKDSGLDIKPIEIRRNPLNKELKMNLIIWLERKVEKETYTL